MEGPGEIPKICSPVPIRFSNVGGHNGGGRHGRIPTSCHARFRKNPALEDPAASWMEQLGTLGLTKLEFVRNEAP